MTRRGIVLGDGRRVSLAAYVHAVRLAKAQPQAQFDRSLTGPFPATGAEIVRQFREGMVRDHCNRGLAWPRERDAAAYLLRRIRRGKLQRSCAWCGQPFAPATVNDRFCADSCAASYR